jgi:hypothetical protein
MSSSYFYDNGAKFERRQAEACAALPYQTSNPALQFVGATRRMV